MDALLEKYNTRSIPYISVEMLQAKQNNSVTILDTRKLEEYQVSHIPNAIWVGERLDRQLLDSLVIKKDQEIIVYCSVGIRSEQYGEQLKKAGYEDVKNLYGSIFSWKDAGYTVLDSLENPTEKIHVFAKPWAKYLKTGEKVYK